MYTAPGSLNQGTADAVLDIRMWHLGRSGDTDAELVSLELLFERAPGLRSSMRRPTP